MSRKKYYVDKKEMYDEIVKSKESGRCSDRLAEMFYAIAEKYSRHRNFRDYERRYGRMFKEDLISAGIMACMRAWNKFDHTKFDNPFAFFTTCIYRAFIGYLSKEYDYSNTKNALKVEQGMRGDYGYEEMIKEQEAVEDEEEEKTRIGIVDEVERLEMEGEEDLEEEIDEEIRDVVTKKKPFRIPDYLADITLWDDSEEDYSEETDPPTTTEMFGVRERKKSG